MWFKSLFSFYFLHKVKRFFHQAERRFKKGLKGLDSFTKERLEEKFQSLRDAIIEKDLYMAEKKAKELASLLEKELPKSFFQKWSDSFLALLGALIIAVLIRTMWFEPYTIPTGSMRPTLKEGDFLLVSKTDFGINVPLRPDHFYFDPSLVQRGSIVVFSAEKMDIADADTTYFYLFPGKKLFVKRLIGKPGDVLYFYGGKIYGIDRNGKEILELQNSSWANSLEHIPFIRFDGKVETAKLKQGLFHEAIFYQMNIPVAKLSTTPFGTTKGELLCQKGVENYSDLWGFEHFAMARILTAKELNDFYPKTNVREKTAFYLELAHHPTLQGAQMIRDEQNRVRPDLHFSTSFFPLKEDHLYELLDHLTTCRFIVQDGVAYRYGMSIENPKDHSFLPKMANIPNGTYEFEKGKAYEIGFGSVAKKLPLDHPLYKKDLEQIRTLYNLGIEFVNYYAPQKNSRIFPSRYAYFKDQELYLCASPIVKKDDPLLASFLAAEEEKKALSTSNRPYFPFKDQGEPRLADGTLNLNLIRKYGLKVPDGMYLALGDNHAMSADSRQFGFVPESNLRGSPSFLFWPAQERFGALPQAKSSHFTLPNLFVIALATFAMLTSIYWTRRRFTKRWDFFHN